MGQRKTHTSRSKQLDHDPLSLIWAIKQAEVTQKWLAEKMGVSPGHLSDMVSGRRNMTPANISRAAKLLKCPRSVLMRSYAEDEAA